MTGQLSACCHPAPRGGSSVLRVNAAAPPVINLGESPRTTQQPALQNPSAAGRHSYRSWNGSSFLLSTARAEHRLSLHPEGNPVLLCCTGVQLCSAGGPGLHCRCCSLAGALGLQGDGGALRQSLAGITGGCFHLRINSNQLFV